jgi:Cof subfamily protein (haloacid dehalogenase superfamily)
LPTTRAPFCVLAIDLDDTLLRSDHTISPRTLASLRRWQDAGHHIVIATGRPTRSIAESLPADLARVPWITYNGAHIYLDGECVYHNLIPADATHTIVEAILTALPDCTLGLEIDDVLYLNRTIDRPSPFEVADLLTVAVQPASKILFFHQDFSVLDSLLKELPPVARAMLSVKYNLVQILAAQADKAEALRHLVAQWGCTLAEVVAFGDDVNDVDMVRDSGLGVAVANAVPEVLAVANRITLSNDEDGVALVIDELLNHPL